MEPIKEYKTLSYLKPNKKYKTFGGWSISETLFNWISVNLPIGSTILEFGSGEGTKYLVENYTVYSIEQNEEWVNYSPKSNYIYAPLVNGWYDIEIVKTNLPKKYDLLLVDGPIGRNRLNFLSHYKEFNCDVPIIIDDTNRTIDKELSTTLSKLLNKSTTEIWDGEKKFTILR
jgi:hypothetical protein